MRRIGPGSSPLKRRFTWPVGVSKKRSGSAGARRLMIDSIPMATGFLSGSLSFTLISQATSQPFGAGPKEYCLMSSSFGVEASALPCKVIESERKSSAL